MVPGGLRSALTLASRLGLAGVELDARNQVHASELSDTATRQLRKILDDLNLRVLAVRFMTRRGYDNPVDLERRIDATKAAMKMAHKLNCPIVVNSIGSIPEIPQTNDSDSKKNPDPFAAIEQDRYDALCQVIDDLGRFGAHVGAFLAAETGPDSGPKLARLLETSEDGFVAAALNPGDLIIHRNDVNAAIDSLGSRIQLIHAVDGVLDLSAGRGISVPLGQGIADFPSILGRLEQHQFAGPLVIGRPGSTPDEITSAAEWLREH